MRLNAHALLALPLVMLLSACALLTESRSGLRVTTDPPNLVLTNEGAAPVFYFAVEQERAALILWGPCDDPDTCDRVDAHSEVRLPYDSLIAASPDADVVLVYWWHLVPKDGGKFEPDRIRVVEVPI